MNDFVPSASTSFESAEFVSRVCLEIQLLLMNKATTVGGIIQTIVVMVAHMYRCSAAIIDRSFRVTGFLVHVLLANIVEM